MYFPNVDQEHINTQSRTHNTFRSPRKDVAVVVPSVCAGGGRPQRLGPAFVRSEALRAVWRVGSLPSVKPRRSDPAGDVFFCSPRHPSGGVQVNNRNLNRDFLIASVNLIYLILVLVLFCRGSDRGPQPSPPRLHPRPGVRKCFALDFVAQWDPRSYRSSTHIKQFLLTSKVLTS